MRTNGIIAPLILLLVFFTPACDHRGPTAPSPSPVPSSPLPVPPVPVTDDWNITVRLTTVARGECVGDTMQSQIGVPKSYSLSIVSKGNMVDVTLRSTSGDYECTFPARVESDGFTTFGVPGWYSCTTSLVVANVACANGSRRNTMRFGQNISGRISGNEISGHWNVDWIIMDAASGNDIAPGFSIRCPIMWP
jgi:hypothetical protein